MLGLSPVRLLIIGVVGLILLGPNKLPEYARQAGAAWRTVRDLQRRVESELREAVPDLPRTADLARYARSPVSLLNQLADRHEAEERAKERAAKGEADPVATNGEGYTPPDTDAPRTTEPASAPIAWGDPSLN